MLLATATTLPANEVGLIVLVAGLLVSAGWLLRLYR